MQLILQIENSLIEVHDVLRCSGRERISSYSNSLDDIPASSRKFTKERYF